jgi:hypothetical protein
VVLNVTTYAMNIRKSAFCFAQKISINLKTKIDKRGGGYEKGN